MSERVDAGDSERCDGARRGRHRRLTIACLLALVFGIVAPSGAAAADVVRGDRIRIGERTRYTDDLYLIAGQATFLGRADQDLTIAAGMSNMVGSVGGDLLIVAGRNQVRGVVGGSVRAAGASVAIYGRVEGDVIVSGGSVRIMETANVAGDVLITGVAATVVAGAVIDGDLRGAARSITIEGRIEGDVAVDSSDLHLTDGSVVGGAVDYRGERAARIDDEAEIRGPTIHGEPEDRLPLGGLLLWSWAALPRLVVLLSLGAALLLVAPRRTIAVADQVRAAPVAATLTGLGSIAIIPVVVALLSVTVVALPLAMVVGSAYAAALYLSQALVGLGIGRVLLRLSGSDGARGRNLLAMALGMTLIAAVRVLPHLNLIGALLTAIVGLGALALTFRSDPSGNASGRLAGDEQLLAQRSGRRGWVAPLAGFAVGSVASLVAMVAVAALVIGLGAIWVRVSQTANVAFQFDPELVAIAGSLMALVALGILGAAWSRHR